MLISLLIIVSVINFIIANIVFRTYIYKNATLKNISGYHNENITVDDNEYELKKKEFINGWLLILNAIYLIVYVISILVFLAQDISLYDNTQEYFSKLLLSSIIGTFLIPCLEFVCYLVKLIIMAMGYIFITIPDKCYKFINNVK